MEGFTSLDTKMFGCAFILLCCVNLSVQITLPWGPFIIPRSGRSVGVQSLTALAKEGDIDTCCDEGIQAEQMIGKDGRVRWSFACPDLCCEGLHMEFEANHRGLNQAICKPDYVIDEVETKKIREPLDDRHLLEKLLALENDEK